MPTPGYWLCLPLGLKDFPWSFVKPLHLGFRSLPPVLAPLAELVREDTNGFLFPPNSPEQIAAVVRNAWDDQQGLEKMARGARHSFLASYTEDANFETLMTIYEEAKAERKNRQIQEVC